MVVDHLHFCFKDGGWIRVFRKVLVERAFDSDEDGGGRVGLAAPVEDELVVQVTEELLGTAFHDLEFAGGEHGIWLGEQVEDCQFLFGETSRTARCS